mgnify:CR=1 FL=1
MGCVLICAILSPMVYLYHLRIRGVEEEKRKIKMLEDEQDKLEYHIEHNLDGQDDQLS